MTPRDTARPHEGDQPAANDLQESQDLLRRLENQPAGNARVTHDETTETKKHIDSEERYAEQQHVGHVSSVLFICTIFIVAAAAIMFISPMILLINNKEQLTNDLNDGLYAYYTYSNKVLGGQLGGGCGDETIKCKFQTMSPMLKERFERYGFLLPGASEADNKRFRVPALVFPKGGGAAANAATLAAMRSRDAKANILVDKVYSSRTGVYQDRQFFERLLTQFGLIQDNTLTGLTPEQFKKSFDKRVAQGDPRYNDDDPATAPEKEQQSQDAIDANGRGIYSLKTLAGMTGQWRGEIYTNLEQKANTHMALACAYASYGSLMENAMMRAKMVTIARFAMNYLALADDLKSFSDTSSSNVAVEVLSSALTLPGKGQTNAMDGDSYRVPALGESLKNRFQFVTQISPLIQLGILKPGAPSLPGTEYLKQSLNVVQTNARDRSLSGLCAQGMAGQQMAFEQQGLCWSPASMPLASYIGVAAGGIIGSARDLIERLLCGPAYKQVVDMVKAATRLEATATLPERLRLLATTEANNFTSSLKGEKAQNAIFAGAGTILGDRAQSLGMRPASAASLMIYLGAAAQARQQIDDQRRELARQTPWDASNPASFLGSIVARVAPAGATLPGVSWQRSVGTLLSALPLSMSTALESSAGALYTQPLHFSPTRLQPATACGLLGGLDGDIMPDFACNVRYSMNPIELNLSISSILDYMTKPHPDNAKGLGEVRARDVAADPERGARMKQQADDGAKAPYIDPKTGRPNKYTEYAKFLEFCVNRQDPWGGVGMVVDTPDPTAPDPDTETRDKDGRLTSNGKSLLREKPDDEKPPESYYGLGWGSKADQDWYTGKNCTAENEMMQYFRGYTMACAVLASMSGSRNCWEEDTIPQSYDDFYVSNNIIFKASS